jgi:hypothetical protein
MEWKEAVEVWLKISLQSLSPEYADRLPGSEN